MKPLYPVNATYHLFMPNENLRQFSSGFQVCAFLNPGDANIYLGHQEKVYLVAMSPCIALLLF